MTEFPLIARHQTVMMSTPACPPLSLPHRSPRRVSCGLFFFFVPMHCRIQATAACRTPIRAPIREPRHTTWPCTRVCTYENGEGKRGTNTVHPPLRAPGRDSCLCLGMQMYRERISRVRIYTEISFSTLIFVEYVCEFEYQLQI